MVFISNYAFKGDFLFSFEKDVFVWHHKSIVLLTCEELFSPNSHSWETYASLESYHD